MEKILSVVAAEMPHLARSDVQVSIRCYPLLSVAMSLSPFFCLSFSRPMPPSPSSLPLPPSLSPSLPLPLCFYFPSFSLSFFFPPSLPSTYFPPCLPRLPLPLPHAPIRHRFAQPSRSPQQQVLIDISYFQLLSVAAEAHPLPSTTGFDRKDPLRPATQRGPRRYV